jgi:hypothetical protein
MEERGVNGGQSIEVVLRQLVLPEVAVVLVLAYTAAFGTQAPDAILRSSPACPSACSYGRS